ncbi:N-acetyltransferase [Gordonia sinesedis]
MTTDKSGAEATVTQNSQLERYEVSVDDGQLAGFTQYRDRDHNGSAERIFYHTEVADEFGGRGLATILITEALDDTKAQDRFIVGVCPLVAAFLKKHPEYEPATHPVTPEVLNWLKTG